MGADSTNKIINIRYPGTKRHFIEGKIFPDVKVGVRQVIQSPSLMEVNGEKQEITNKPINIYDTTGPYGDENMTLSYEDGIPAIREAWTSKRKAGETQMYYAKKGIITPEMEYVAIRENMNASLLGIDMITPDFVRKQIAAGRAIIPASNRHPQSEPMILGKDFSVKTYTTMIYENNQVMDMPEEISTLIRACSYGFSNLSIINRAIDKGFKNILKNVPIPLTSTPINETFYRLKGDINKLSWEAFKDVLEEHAEMGIDILNLHADKCNSKNERISRNLSVGGAIISKWCEINNKYNFIYEHFDEICDICAKTDTVIGISSTVRASSIYDSSNRKKQREEKILMSELVNIANEKNVQIYVEGFGYSSIDKIQKHIDLQEEYCPGTPFNTSIPAVIDIAMPYDNTVKTIGSSIAGYMGTSLLGYDILLREILNNENSCKKNAMSFNVSAYSANLAKGHMDTVLRNNAFYRAKQEGRVEDLCNLSIDPVEMEKLWNLKTKDPFIIGMSTIFV